MIGIQEIDGQLQFPVKGIQQERMDSLLKKYGRSVIISGRYMNRQQNRFCTRKNG